MKWKRSKKAAQGENKAKVESSCSENESDSNKFDSNKNHDLNQSLNEKSGDVLNENFSNKKSNFSKSNFPSHLNNGCSSPSLSEFKSLESINNLCSQVWPVNLNRHLSECNRNISNISIPNPINNKKLHDPFYRPYVV